MSERYLNSIRSMKLGDSMTEANMRDGIASGSKDLWESERGAELLKAISEIVPDIGSAFVYSWNQDEDEEYYSVVVNGTHWAVLTGEPAISPGVWAVEVLHLADGIKRMSGIDRIRLAVILSLHNAQSPNHSLQARRP